MPDGRVLIAFGDGPLETDPTWVRIDDTPNLVSKIEIHRGRQTELDVTNTSTATVYLNDTGGLFDPANTSSPYFGNIDGKQIMLQLRNPVTDEWVTQYRGFIDDYGYDIHPDTRDGVSILSNIQVECVDLFDFFAGIEMIPGLFGDVPPPAGAAGKVFYDNADVQTRLTQVATDGFKGDATKTAFWCVFFTGNVELRESQYDPGDSLLVALRDPADAEFPTISNIYTDKRGRIVFHGRDAKFNPDAVAADAGPDAWTFTRWLAGDGAAILIDDTTAQIRPPVSWSRPRNRIVNSALCYPDGISQQDIPGQIITDDASIDAYGYRSWSATDLIVKKGTTTGNNALDECKLYATFIVANYRDPQTHVEALTFLAISPDDLRAAAVWGLICGVDISDIVNLRMGYAGGVGLDGVDHFVEGSDMTIEPAAGDAYDMVTLTVNVSPFAYYTISPF